MAIAPQLLTGTGYSLIPEGIEKSISKDEMVDLVAFLTKVASGRRKCGADR
jgi:hypothetical protein